MKCKVNIITGFANIFSLKPILNAELSHEHNDILFVWQDPTCTSQKVKHSHVLVSSSHVLEIH